MSSRVLNVILVVAIAVALGVIAFFGIRVWDKQSPSAPESVPEKFVPAVIENKGKESEARDAAMEQDVRAIATAVEAYAKDHAGTYPESDFKNPCMGVRFCLKGTDINTEGKVYLARIPQTPEYKGDYYYRADNKAHTYCVRTPHALETAHTLVFQCTQAGCGRAAFANACEQ